MRRTALTLVAACATVATAGFAGTGWAASASASGPPSAATHSAVSASGGSGLITSPTLISALRAQVRAGTFAKSHGVYSPCTAAHASCRALVATGAPGSDVAIRSSKPIGLTPAELSKAFSLGGAPAPASMVTIIGQGRYPTLASDLAVYRKTFGLKACTVENRCLTLASYAGGPPVKVGAPGFEEGAAYETSLDVDMVSAACPSCRITYLSVPASAGNDAAIRDFAKAVLTAKHLGSSAVSISWGFDVSAYSDFGKPSRELLQPGMGIFSASGDFGFMNPQTFQTGVGGWPQNLRSVVSVGGTTVTTYPGSPTGYFQSAWDGSGSGCSPDLAAAYGQPASISASCKGGRAVVDIAADADPNSGPATYDSYAPQSHQPPSWVQEGGTSAASPFVASIAARAELPNDMIGPNDLYKAPRSDFTDITSGSNALPGTCQSYGFARRVCESVQGWDGPTGLGTPLGVAPFEAR